MKLSGQEAARFFANPRADCPGVLVYGADRMRVSLRRQQLVKALVGENADEEMRFTQIHASALRKDPAQVSDAMKAQGFFPGARVVLVQEAGDFATKALGAALSDWQPGDASLVVTAGSLAARSSLRKLFETHRSACAAPVYTDPPSRADVESALKKAGIAPLGEVAMTDLIALSRALDPGDFAQMIEKLALYKWQDETPTTSADIAAVAPSSSEAALDDAINLIAEARVAEVAPLMRRLQGQGLNPTTICIGATRHFRTLHHAVSHPKGPEAGLMASRPPVFGARRERMSRQARALGVHKVENMLGILMDTDLALRSARPVPAQAMLERAFIRIAMMARS